MDQPPLSRFRLRALIVPAALAAVFLVLAGYLLLPLVVERAVIPAVFKAAGIRDYSLPVRRLGLFGSNLGTFRIGAENKPGITVVSISTAHTPAGFFRKHISSITLEGVEIVLLEKADGQFEIPGLPPLKGDTGADGPQAFSGIPVSIDRIEIRQGRLNFYRNGRWLRIPFEASADSAPNRETVTGILKILFMDQPVTVNARADLTQNELSVNWQGGGIRLASLADVAGWSEAIAVSGSATVTGQAQASLFPFQPGPMKVEIRHTPCRLNIGAVRLQLSGETDKTDMWITASTRDSRRWQIDSSPVNLVHRDVRAVGRLTGILNISDEGIGWEGGMRFEAESPIPGNKDTVVRLPYALKTVARLSPEGKWQAQVEGDRENEAPERIRVDMAETTAQIAVPSLTVAAEGFQKTAEADVRWELPGLSIKTNTGLLTLPSLSGEGRFELDGQNGKAVFSTTSGPAAYQGDGVTGRLKRIRLTGELSRSPEAPFQLASNLSLAGGTVSLPEMEFKASGFKIQVPLAWPTPEKRREGAFSLADMTWKDKSLGAVSGRVRQTREGIAFSVNHENRLIPGLKVAARGAANASPGEKEPFAWVRWTAERPGDSPKIALGDIVPDPPEIPISFNGALRAQGEAAYAKTGLSGSLEAGIDSGRIEIDDQGLVIGGIRTILRFPEINRIRSAPFQKMTFDTITFGTIRAENGRFDFQIEPGPTMFLEGARFKWCDGEVIVPATRFRPGVHEYDITVYCDRLKLDQLLEQLGLAKAEGGGALNGLIPLTFADGRLSFNNGFLYSTPGEGGVIRVQGSEVLTAGIPPGTPQYNQMELARYALKDYDYKWAKIVMNTVEDDLLLQLQFDGKPAEPLPFVYRPEAGGFVKVGPESQGSVFQGIRLDVNFRLPLNRMLRYRELLKGLP